MEKNFDADRYVIMPFKVCIYLDVVNYWIAVERAGSLPDRMGNVRYPTLEDVWVMLRDNGDFCHYIFDLASDAIVAEFLIMPISGKMGTIHFSVHPDLAFARVVSLGTWASDQALNTWKDIDAPDEPYLTSLVGLTPVKNTRARLCVIRMGFKRVTNVVDGCHYKGEVAAAMMSLKQKPQLTG